MYGGSAENAGAIFLPDIFYEIILYLPCYARSHTSWVLYG